MGGLIPDANANLDVRSVGLRVPTAGAQFTVMSAKSMGGDSFPPSNALFPPIEGKAFPDRRNHA